MLSIAECSEHSGILSTFIKHTLRSITILVLSIFEWLFYTGFTVLTQRLDVEEGLNKNIHLVSLLRFGPLHSVPKVQALTSLFLALTNKRLPHSA